MSHRSFTAAGENPIEPVEVMYAVRESSLGNPELLEGMVYQTLGPHASDPLVAEVLTFGIEPLQGKCPYPHHLSTASHTKSVIFTAGNCAFLYALGSASTANSTRGENQFVETLCDALISLTPRRLRVHEFARLVRSADWGSKLLRALERTGTVVESGGIAIDVRTQLGRMQFQFMTLIADQDRMGILGRLFGGVVNKHKRGLWIPGPESVPPGYRIEDGVVTLNPTQIEPVKYLISLLADPTLSARHVMDLAGKAGCTSTTLRRIYGPDATYADVSRADSKLRSLLSHLDIWESGGYVLRLPNPFPGKDRYGEYLVHGQSPPDSHGYVDFPYELELPRGGWATPEEFSAARQRLLPRTARQASGAAPSTGGASHRKRRPLSGWATWTNATHHYRLTGNSAFYLLFQRPLIDELAWTHDQGRNADRIASIDTQEFHDAIVSSTIAALRTGAGVELIDALRFWKLSDVRTSLVNQSERKLKRLASDIEQVRKAYDRARYNANRMTDGDLIEDFLADAVRLRGKLRQLEQEYDEHSQVVTPLAPDQFTSDAAFIAYGIASLASCGADAPAELADQLAQVLEFVDVDLDLVARTVTFTFQLLLPADGKVATFGPITATVPNHAYPGTLKGLPRLEEARSLLCRRADRSPHRAVRQLAARLVDKGWVPLAGSTLARSGVNPLYRIALRHLGDEQPISDLGAQFVQHVLSTYGDPDFSWNPRYHHVDCTNRQRIIDAVLAAGGQSSHQDLIDQLAGTDVPTTEVNIASRTQEFGTAPPWPPSVLRSGDWSPNSPRSGRSLHVVKCPHCDGWASKAIRTPEVPSGLLCPDCLKMPTSDSPVFPATYLDL